MNQLYSDEGSLRSYYVFPKGLLGLGLNDTDKSVYLLLLDRDRLSGRGGADWRDGQGRVFLYYPIASLAGALNCSETAVYNSMNALEKKDLVFRQRQGCGKPNRIYVKLPEEVNKAGGPDLYDPGDHDRKLSGDPASSRLDPNKKERNKKSYSKERQRSSCSYGAKTNSPAGPTREEYAYMQRLLAKMEAKAEQQKSR